MWENSAGQAFKKTKSSAITPLLWLNLLILPGCGALAIFFRDDQWLRNRILLSALCVIAVDLVMYAGFAILRPSALESEDYRLRNLLLNALERRGEIPVIPVDATAVAISNPALLPSGPRDAPAEEER